MQKNFFMKNLVIIFGILVISLVNGYSQDAEKIFDCYIKKSGIIDFDKEIKCLKIVGKTVSPMGEFVTTIYRKLPNLIRLESDIQGNKIIQSFDGEKAWMVNPFMGFSEPQILDEKQSMMIKFQAKQETLFKNYKENGISINYESEEKVKNVDCCKLKIKYNDGNVENIYYMYIGKNDCLPIKISYNTEFGDVDIFYSDYKSIKNNIYYPYKIEMIFGNQFSNTTTIEQIIVNQDINDDIFKIK